MRLLARPVSDSDDRGFDAVTGGFIYAFRFFGRHLDLLRARKGSVPQERRIVVNLRHAFFGPSSCCREFPLQVRMLVGTLRTRTLRYFRSQIAGRGSVLAAPHVLAELGARADPGSCHLFLRPVPGENLIENNGAERGGADTAHGEVAELERQIAGASGERGSDCDKISRV